MKSNRELPYCTDTHEFYISWDKSTAIITCKFENEAEAFNNPILLSEFKEMILSANTKGVKEIQFNSNYSIQVHSHQWKEIEKKEGIKLTKISN